MVQIRYMLMSLTEAYKIFNSMHPSKIGSSKFCELRPQNIKLFEHIPHSVCVCSYHENIRLLLVALKNHTMLSDEFHHFIGQVTCDPSSKECMTRTCEDCANLLDTFAPSEEETPIKYQQWLSGEKVEKANLIASVQDVFSELKKQLKDFLLHTFVKRNQATHMENLISGCDGENVVLQVDFSENASIMAQNEIQSAHWGHGQATLFTTHAWIDGVQNESIVLISDYLSHGKKSVYVYMTYIMKLLKEKYPNMKMLNIFSDGASSQFKQRYLFSDLHTWELQHGIRICWNFFATSHGKGVVDGLGGTVKRSVWRYVRSGHVNITTPCEYAEVARERNPNIHISFIPVKAIEEKSKELDKFWEGVLAVPKTHQLHCIRTHGPKRLMVGETSNAAEFRVVPIRDNEEEDEGSMGESEVGTDEEEDQDVNKEPGGEVGPKGEGAPAAKSGGEAVCPDFSIGKWVVVTYDNDRYPGEITNCSNKEVQVNVRHKCGNYWKWPETPDNVLYPKEAVIKTITHPTVVGSRGQFQFTDNF